MTAVADREVAPPRSFGLRRWLSLVGVFAVAAALVWVIGFSRVLGVRSITVLGARQVTAEQVSSAAGVPLGTPLIRLDAAAISRRVSTLPEVRQVKVSTSYPSTLRVQITERVAVGYRTAGPQAVLVDADDVGFRKVARPPTGLPKLDPSGDAARSAAVAAVAGSLPPSVAREVASISAPTTESIACTLADGRVVLWGDTDRDAEKAKLLRALFGQPGTYFDVSDPDAVISRGTRGP